MKIALLVVAILLKNIKDSIQKSADARSKQNSTKLHLSDTRASRRINEENSDKEDKHGEPPRKRARSRDEDAASLFRDTTPAVKVLVLETVEEAGSSGEIQQGGESGLNRKTLPGDFAPWPQTLGPHEKTTNPLFVSPE